MNLIESDFPEATEVVGNEHENAAPKDAFDEFLSNFSKENVSANVTKEQLERMNENKRRAEEKRKSRLIYADEVEKPWENQWICNVFNL